MVDTEMNSNMVSNSLILVFSCLFIFEAHASPSHMSEFLKSKPNFDKCVASSGLDINTLRDEPSSPEALCFAKCMAEGGGIIDADGVVNTEMLFDEKDMAQMNPEEMEKAQKMKECVKNAVVKECGDMMQFMTCADKIIQNA